MLPISNRKPERIKAGRKAVMMAICPAANWLRRGGGEHGYRSQQRHSEKPHGDRHRSRHSAHTQHKIGNQFGDQDLKHADAGDHQRLHRAPFPFPGDHHGRQQRTGQRHDHRNETWHQIIPAVDSRVEPDPLLHRDGNWRWQSCFTRPLPNPARPYLLYIEVDPILRTTGAWI
jgi:hypothetical protein